jgi:VIT1/CCC1 family predicted Fe2+/Mn2+ transporter
VRPALSPHRSVLVRRRNEERIDEALVESFPASDPPYWTSGCAPRREEGALVRAPRPNRYSYGSTAAIVTSVGLIVGLGAASVSKAAVLSGLLIIALADNLTDSLSIHIYQESENLESRAAFGATVTNFAARLLVALSFVGIALVFHGHSAAVVAMAWGLLLLGALTFHLSRARKVPPLREITKHLVVAIVVVLTSRMLGAWIAAHVSS